VKRLLSFVAVVVLFFSAAYLPARAAQEAAAPAPSLTKPEMEKFLLEAEIGRIRGAGSGVTNSEIASLSDGRLTHAAHIQDVDESRPRFEAGGRIELNFRDSYKFNIAAYRLSVLLGMDNVPMSVDRRVRGKPSAVTWWLDDVLMNEKQRVAKKVRAPDLVRHGQQIQIMRVFDELIQNVDRNQENLVWDKSWKLWLIDHTRAFRIGHDLRKPEELVACDRALFEGLRRLTLATLTDSVGDYLTKREMEAVMARRDLLVQHYEAVIAKRGESALFTLLPASN
jgi:hypothetical protein